MECSDSREVSKYEDWGFNQTVLTCRRIGGSVSRYRDRRHPDCPVYGKDRFKEEYIPATVIATEEIEKLDDDVFTLFDMFVDKFNSDTKLKSNTYYFYKDGIKISVKIEKEYRK